MKSKNWRDGEQQKRRKPGERLGTSDVRMRMIDRLVEYLTDAHPDLTNSNPLLSLMYGVLMGLKVDQGLTDSTLLVQICRDCAVQDDIDLPNDFYSIIGGSARILCDPDFYKKLHQDKEQQSDGKGH